MRAVLLNGNRLNFDGNLSFKPIEDVVDLIYHETTDPDQVIKRAKGCEILITKELPMNGKTIMCLPDEVSLICEAGTGYDNIDPKAVKERNLKVCNVPGYSTDAVALLTFCFLLAMSIDRCQLLQGVAPDDLADFWEQHGQRIDKVKGTILGVIGAGTIGQEVIRRAREYGMTVLVCNRSKRTWGDTKIKQVDLNELLEKSQFVTLHRSLQKDSPPLMRSEEFLRMKQGAYIINTARGGLIDHEALAVALKSGHLAGAALDVQDPEPLPRGNPLRSMDNVILTNHIGWKSTETRKSLIKEVARNIQAFIDTGTPLNQVHSS